MCLKSKKKYKENIRHHVICAVNKGVKSKCFKKGYFR